MPELKIDLSSSSHQTLLTLAKTCDATIEVILDRAIEAYRRELFLTQANQSYDRLKQDDILWADELAERELWQQTLSDDLEDS